MSEQVDPETVKNNRKPITFVILTVAVLAIVVVLIGLGYYMPNRQADSLVNRKSSNSGAALEYVSRLFREDTVHTVNIVISKEDWQSLQTHAKDKAYKKCEVVIDGTTFQGAAIRTKGNSSLDSVANKGSRRYSFKIEFDHYDKTLTCWGLDKLSLNNMVDDPTYMKDYLCYTLMRDMGADAPLCSYVDVLVNGENFGLYLAAEGIEEAFVLRNYGAVNGNLYKPEPSYGLQDLKESAGDAALKYIDDQIGSYHNIFDNSILNATDQDKQRLISSIKQLNSGENLEQILNTEEILRYFTVHNFVDNYDSYTGKLLHNYYLYEKGGKLSMIAWDYNLAFGCFDMGQGRGNPNGNLISADGFVNYPIDTPVSGTAMQERPLLNELLTKDEYRRRYHELLDEFITNYIENGYCDKLIDHVSSMIEPYVEKDRTAFYTTEQFRKGVKALKAFCDLRAKSVRGQLSGSIPSTNDGQKGSDSLIDAGSLSLQELGAPFGRGQSKWNDIGENIGELPVGNRRD